MIEQVHHIARQSVEHNKISTLEGILLAAGGNQFRSLWLRDFCFAVPGLLLMGEAELVKRQIEVFLHHMRSDGLMPRGLDVIDPQTRVLLNTGFRFLPKILKQRSYRFPLKPEYFGEHKTVAFDSNILILKAAWDYIQHTGDQNFLLKHSEQFKKIHAFYRNFRSRGLVIQPAFSDWQDSARREGSSFYSHILLLKVETEFEVLGHKLDVHKDLVSFKARIFEHFYEPATGLFKNIKEHDYYCLESQLWAIEWNLFSEFVSQKELFESLKKSPLWDPLAGRPTAPEYDIKEISWTTKMAGLKNYHDQFYWSWLVAEAARVSHFLGYKDSCEKLFRELAKVILKHEVVHEIYELQNDLTPVKRLFYASEAPFSWGASKVYELSHALLQSQSSEG